MLDRRLRLLLGCKPNWFSVAEKAGARVAGAADIEVNALDSITRYDLEIVGHRDAIRVREIEGTARLPGRCAERHIEFDGWFCLGLHAGSGIGDRRAAATWWERLHKFLRLQRSATRNGVWPDRYALAHGQAGVHHQAALSIATELGIDDEYEALLLSRPSRLSAGLPLLMSKADRYKNGRAACPCGCAPVKGRPRLRRNCPWLRSVLPLLVEERQRRRKLDAFWADARSSGAICCGTMKSCPLRPATELRGGQPDKALVASVQT
jgi:hypothetical protein